MLLRQSRAAIQQLTDLQHQLPVAALHEQEQNAITLGNCP